MSREITNFNSIENTPEGIYRGLLQVREDFDSHIHDGTNSKEFDTLHVRTLVASNSVIAVNSLAVNKKSYTDDTAGFWTGITSGVAKLYLGNTSNSVKWDGTTLTITGTFNATAGTIGGWVISATSIADAAGVVGLSSAVTGGDDLRIWAGDSTPASAEFRVYESGAFVASSATITGAITATSGTIGSFTIGTYLYTGSKTAYNDTNTGVHVGSDGIGIGNNVFTVSSTGALVATSATITGTINASGGTFSGTITASGTISGGTISGATVQTSTGNSRIKLVSDTIEFYSGGNLKATLDGSADGAGGVKNTGDFFLSNNRTYWIAASGGGSTTYGGVGITSSNQFWLTLGTGNTFYMKNNAQNDNYFTVSNTQLYSGRPFQFPTYTYCNGLSASAYPGIMMFSTNKTDLVFSNGVQWYTVTATAITIDANWPG